LFEAFGFHLRPRCPARVIRSLASFISFFIAFPSLSTDRLHLLSIPKTRTAGSSRSLFACAPPHFDPGANAMQGLVVGVDLSLHLWHGYTIDSSQVDDDA